MQHRGTHYVVVRKGGETLFARWYACPLAADRAAFADAHKGVEIAVWTRDAYLAHHARSTA